LVRSLFILSRSRGYAQWSLLFHRIDTWAIFHRIPFLFYNELIKIKHSFQEDSMKRSFGFVFGALMGGVIGAAAALLFAPSSGVQLRALIGERSQNFTADIRQAANVKQIELRDRLESLRAPRP
jgi:hypothetical protein